MYIRRSLLQLYAFAVLLQTRQRAEGKDETCFQAHFLKVNTTDSPPRYLLTMFSPRMSYLSSVAMVNDVVRVPYTKFAIIQSDDRTGHISVIYNMTRKACEFMDIIKRVPMVKTLVSGTMKSGNFSFECPMPKGVYAFYNVSFRSRNPLFSILYNPKKTITVYGGTSEQLPDMSLKALTRYMVQFKVIKRKC